MKTNISKNKVWQIIGVSVLCAVLVLGAVLGVVFGMNHSSEDLNVSKDMSERKPDDSFVMETQAEQGISLFMSDASASADGTTSKVITATVSPNDASTLEYGWSVGFKNDSSTWASGKNVSDYVSVVQDSSNKLKATVTFKKRFSEQIIVTVYCVIKPTVKASATVDCYKELVGYEFLLKDQNTANKVTAGYVYDKESFQRDDNVGNGYLVCSDYDFTEKSTFGDGTITPEICLKFEVKNNTYDSSDFPRFSIIAEHEDLSNGYLVFFYIYYNGKLYSSNGLEMDFYTAPNSLSVDTTSIVF